MPKLLKGKNGYKISVILMVILDIMAINISSFLALMLRFDFQYSQIDEKYLDRAVAYAPIETLILLAVLFLCRLYRGVWSFAGISELTNIIKAVAAGTIINIIIMFVIHDYYMPRSYVVLFGILWFFFLLLIRFGYRFATMIQKGRNTGGINVMIVGAGSAGMALAREIKSSDYIKKTVKCFIDDDPNKQGRYMAGIMICGTRDDIETMTEKYDIDEIYVAMPSVPKNEVSAILNICNRTMIKTMVLPGIYQLVNGDVSISKLKEVDIDDLLEREPIKVDMTEIEKNLTGKVILVTGGGGSIGSELCRQIASYSPKQLIILDIYENNAYDIQQELKRSYGERLNLTVLIGSVRNTHRMEGIFEKYHPQIVFHAAAHKHVPLMEDSPNEAIKNNVFGTYKTADIAGRYGAQRFVLISTDKAVNPTNIMGASKRLCEMVVQCLNKKYRTEYVAVRFGNVLGSNGSVIPLFRKQIADGGPVTVTHKDIVRYFMTIPEAVSLVLQAETYASGGEIFVLDMGKPVKIDSLARKLIRLSGYEPDVDIMIEYTGLRPGEKLYEEILMAEEGLKETENHLIHIGKPIEMDYNMFETELSRLKTLCDNDSDEIREAVQRLVPTYRINN